MDPKLNAYLLVLKWASMHFKTNTNDMILRIQNAVD